MLGIDCILYTHVRIQRGGQESQKYRFLRNIGPDPLRITKLPIQHSKLGHHHAIEMAFRWQADGGPLIVVFGSSRPLST